MSRTVTSRRPAGRDGAVSVVAATRNRRSELRRSLAHLVALPEIADVVVVDNASSDGTQADVRRRFPDVRLIELDADHGPATRPSAERWRRRPGRCPR